MRMATDRHTILADGCLSEGEKDKLVATGPRYLSESVQHQRFPQRHVRATGALHTCTEMRKMVKIFFSGGNKVA